MDGLLEQRDALSAGLMVQKGKFSAGTFILVRMLKRVDLPTFGRPERTR